MNSDVSPSPSSPTDSVDEAKFKEQCLSLLERLTPEGLIITKRGKPVARLIPYPQTPAALIGSLRERIRIHDDVLSTRLDFRGDPADELIAATRVVRAVPLCYSPSGVLRTAARSR
jgi:antitoxin (DNA-binding transcriptional repressor) of toxin-antitoxin stability system